MRYTALCILLLVVSEPLLIHAKKLVVVFPRQIRRSPGPPWRSGGAYYKKSSHGNGDSHQHVYHSHPPQYYPRRPMYRNPPFPHGGDDFDQGHETVNHVRIPYGKDISHAITYGKGYIPYDNIKGSFSFGHERYPMVPSHKNPEPNYAATNFQPSGSEIAMHHLRHVYDNPHADMHFSDAENEYRERRNDQKNKFYVGRSIERDLGVRTHMELNSPVEKDKEQLQKGTEIYKEVLPQRKEVQGTVVVPAAVQQSTIGGSKEGFVFSDSISLDAYQKQVEELTKTWPSILTGGAANLQSPSQVYATAKFPTAGLPGSSFTGSTGWLADFAQPKQGYAVKEELAEPPHDFRNMPMQATSFQNLPLGINLAMASPGHAVHG